MSSWVVLKNDKSQGLNTWDYHAEPSRVTSEILKSKKPTGWSIVGIYPDFDAASAAIDEQIKLRSRAKDGATFSGEKYD